MRVRFWGTRGSIPKSGPGVLRHGGATSCVEVVTAAGTLLVLDCGTGAHGLGQELAASGRGRAGHLLITHTHWDHIQGLPFFAPLFAPGSRWDVYGPRGVRRSLQETLAGQMQSAYFPVALEDLGAEVRFHELVEGTFRIAEVAVSARYLNHPALTLGYRLEADRAALVYTPDHEPHARALATGRGPLVGEDLRHAGFLRGADLVVHDAQYTPGEYRARVGWGHSTGEYAARVCAEAGAKALALTHHDPLRDDDGIDRIVRGGAAALGPGCPLRVFAAAEGAKIELAGDASAAAAAAAGAPAGPMEASAADRAPASLVQERPVVVGVADPGLARAVSEALRPDGFRLLHARGNAEAAALVAVHRPALVLLEDAPGAFDGPAACRAIRGLPAGAGDPRELPVVLLSARGGDAAEPGPGVTERLGAPFSRAYLQARARAWILRQACRWRRAALPAGEERRLAALRSLGVLDAPADERLDRLTRLAAAALGTPIALVTLVDRERQRFKARHGLGTEETHRDESFCAHALEGDGPLVVPDALLDDRFAENPMVTGAPRIRFYAGHPLRTPEGAALGALCAIDTRPREPDAATLDLLRDLGALAAEELLRR